MSEAHETPVQMDTAEDAPLSPSSAPATEEKLNLRFEILASVKASQTQNGLRHNDYTRYRKYCARRLHRLRKSLNFLHPRKDFKPKVLEPRHVTDARYLALPLMSAERCWSMAMALKNELAANNDSTRQRVHLIARMAKAVHYSSELVRLCAAKADVRTQLEAEAYHNFLRGTYLMEREQHADAARCFTKAQAIYEHLSAVSAPEVASICEEKLAQLAPTVRYCKYLLQRMGGEEGAKVAQEADEEVKKDDKLMDLFKQSSSVSSTSDEQKGKGSEGSITWRGQTVQVKNAAIRAALKRADDLISQIQQQLRTPSSSSSDIKSNESTESKSVMTLYNALFSAYEEVLKNCRHLLREMASGGQSDASKDALVALQAYANYHKLRYAIERCTVQADTMRLKQQQSSQRQRGNKRKISKPEDLVAVYDKLLQHVSDLRSLDADNDDESSQQAVLIASHAASARAFRCHYVAEAHRRKGQFKEAAALFDRASQLASEAVQSQTIQNMSTLEQLQTLAKEAQSQRAVVQASALMDQEEKSQALNDSVARLNIDDSKEQKQAPAGSSLPLLDRLDQFDAGLASEQHSLVNFPPKLETVPCKPVLFDLAFNSLQYPDLSKRVQVPKAAPTAAAAASEPAKPAGFFGRIFGGR